MKGVKHVIVKHDIYAMYSRTNEKALRRRQEEMIFYVGYKEYPKEQINKLTNKQKCWTTTFLLSVSVERRSKGMTLNMTKIQLLRDFVNQRLTVAAGEICELFENTIAAYEAQLCRLREKNEQQQRQLDAFLSPECRPNSADVPQLLLNKNEFLLEQQDCSPGLDHEDTEPPSTKKEQQDLWSSQDEEQLEVQEEADTTMFLFIPVPVKSEDVEENPQPSQLHERQTEQMETEADNPVNEGPEPAKHTDPVRHLQAETEVQTGDSFQCETPESVDFNGTRKQKPHLKSLENIKCRRSKKPFGCFVCGKNLKTKHHLIQHVRTHTGERPFSCSVCSKEFNRKGNMQRHMLVHLRNKVFSCP
ncbi:gastrula zinc finger protein XlCGF57.1-like [Xyrichtys novacula]|uniref:Gastrula zinc finger protein XlCGF57.1-like n=1 Tax=Xyrichtys novacula TaxID=13765 RepID=A0AAV1GV92_XYRNO|nr:gastrula zinc finger protein XlCGF57.1-like [Xyrichtys novacula]